MPLIKIVFLMFADANVYKLTWETLYYGERSVKDCAHIWLRSSNLTSSIVTNQ